MNHYWNYIYDCPTRNVQWEIEKLVTNNRGFLTKSMCKGAQNTTMRGLQCHLEYMGMTDMRGLDENGSPNPLNPIVNTPEGPIRRETAEFHNIIVLTFENILANKDLLVNQLRETGRRLDCQSLQA